jgi:hypothetical protein
MKRHVVHAGLAAAVVVAAGLAFTSSVESQTAGTGSAVSTPRLPNGKPDLSGIWGRTDRTDEGFTQKTDEVGNIARLFPSRRCAPNQLGCRDNTNQSNDGEFTGRTDPNRPLYKPEYWDNVQQLDYDTNFSDPMFRCQPDGVPRIGLPMKIVQTVNEVIFLYAGSNRNHDFRIIPTDGRGHDPDAFPTYFGDSVGRWEGDTLVIDVVSRNDNTWLGRQGGYFHSYELHVIERLRREGNTLYYDVTVEDPSVLLKPWVMNTRQVRLNTDPKATIAEGLPCHDYDAEITVSRIRH